MLELLLEREQLQAGRLRIVPAFAEVDVRGWSRDASSDNPWNEWEKASEVTGKPARAGPRDARRGIRKPARIISGWPP